MAPNSHVDVDQPSTSNINYDDIDNYFDNALDSDDSNKDFSTKEDEESYNKINPVWCNTTARLRFTFWYTQKAFW